MGLIFLRQEIRILTCPPLAAVEQGDVQQGLGDAVGASVPAGDESHGAVGVAAARREIVRADDGAGDDGGSLRAVRLVRAQRAHHLVVVEVGRGAGAGPVRRVGEVNLGACLRRVRTLRTSARMISI